MSLLTVGSIAFDSIKTPFKSVQNILGGSASYCSIAASYFTDVNLVGAVGEDFSDDYLNIFKKRKINIDGLKKLPGKTFHWEGSYEYDLNQAHTLKTELNVLSKSEAVFPLPKNYEKSRYVFLGNIDPDMQNMILDRIKNPQLIACDTMNYWIENKKNSLEKVIKSADILTINEGEIRQLAREANIIKAAKKILAKNKNNRLKIIIIKRGEYGALMFHHDSIFAAPGFPLENITDPTGAGDSFAGGFMGYISNVGDISEKNFRKAVIIGSVMASLKIENFSLEYTKKLTMKNIQLRCQTFQKIINFEKLI